MNRKNWCEYCEEGKEARHAVHAGDWAMGTVSACDDCDAKLQENGEL